MTPAPTTSAFRIELGRSAEQVVCRCTGKLNSDAAAYLKSEIKPLFGEYPEVVLDFTHVISMDSAGLGAVVSLYVSAKSARRDFQLVNFNQRIRELLGLTKLLSAFETCGQYMIRLP